MARTIIGTAMKFGAIAPGTIFALRGSIEFDFGKPVYLNIKIATPEYGKVPTFNVVALEDGRVRTFHDDERVYAYNKADLFV